MIHVKILEKGAVTRYKKDGKQDRVMASVIIADKTASMKGLVYDLGNLEMMHIKSGVKIQDFIPKRDANNNTLIVINKFTQVFMSSDIEIPQSLEESALKIDKSFSTAEASLSPKKTTVGQMTGIVTHVEAIATRTVRATQEEVQFRKMKVRDETGVIPVCLWRDLATPNINTGDCVQLKNFMVTDTFNSTRKTVPAIANKFSTATVEIIPPVPELLTIMQDDGSDVETETSQSTKITGVGKVTKYLSCQNSTCYRKKLQGLKCPKCGITYTEQSAGRSIIGSICTEDDGPLIFFTQQGDCLTEELDLDCSCTDNNFSQLLAKNIPFHAKITKQENKLVKIKVIHN